MSGLETLARLALESEAARACSRFDATAAMTASLLTFNALRPRLFGIAYRMLGLRPDAEDVLQDAWLRWCETDQSAVRSAEGWLVTVVTRLAIDRLRVAKIEREAYAGAWLPEPIVALDEQTPEAVAELASDLSLAFLHLLERLGPEERAAFLLRQVFDYDYGEVADMLGKREPAVRQIVHRAAERVRQGRPRFTVPVERHRDLLQKFIVAAQTGDRAAIRELLADDVTALADGGGKGPAVLGGLRGRDRITNLFWAHAMRFGPRVTYRLATINGELGLLRYVDGGLETAISIETDGHRIVAIFGVRNPDKLANIAA